MGIGRYVDGLGRVGVSAWFEPCPQCLLVASLRDGLSQFLPIPVAKNPGIAFEWSKLVGPRAEICKTIAFERAGQPFSPGTSGSDPERLAILSLPTSKFGEGFRDDCFSSLWFSKIEKKSRTPKSPHGIGTTHRLHELLHGAQISLIARHQRPLVGGFGTPIAVRRGMSFQNT
jgi:hypothetical protein